MTEQARIRRYPMGLTEEEPGVWRTKPNPSPLWFELRRLIVVEAKAGTLIRAASVRGTDETAARPLIANSRVVAYPWPASVFSAKSPASSELPEPFAILRPGDVLTVETVGVLLGIGVIGAEVSPKQRYYLSWADDTKSLGIAIVEVDRDLLMTEESGARQFIAARRRAEELGLGPGGQCAGWLVPDFQAPAYDDVMNRLLTGAEALEVGGRQRCVALLEELDGLPSV